MTKNEPPRKALGKGLHALLPSRKIAEAPAEQTSGAPGQTIKTLSIQSLTPNPDQPRRDFDPQTLRELAASIERDGVIQPLIVRETESNKYQIIAGERRWRASQIAGLTEVPVIVRSADDQKVLELALIENIQREDLNPIDLALAFHRMAGELGLSHEQIGQRTGKERTTITNTVRLLQLPQGVQTLVSMGQLSPGHARALLKFDNEELQREVADKCVAEGWSVRQIENYTRELGKIKHADPKKTKEQAKLDPNVKAAVDELSGVLGTKVKLVERGGNRGHIEIDYYSSEDLNRIYELIVGQAG
jgi:ParB family chromosome partitioning protein